MEILNLVWLFELVNLDGMGLNIKNYLYKISDNKYAVPLFLLILTIFISIQKINLGTHHFWDGEYTHYNNYIIFKCSFINLIENKNLYIFHPNLYADLFKYSPTFALFMGFFYWLPDTLGLTLWNCLNVGVLYLALSKIKNTHITPYKITLIFLYVLLELILTTQNSQSNALLTGLIILTFNKFETGKNSQATLLIALGFFIKIFSGISCLLLFLYPRKVQSILFFLMWSLILFILPLLVIEPSELITQYKNWYFLLMADEARSLGMSIYLYTSYLLPENLFKVIPLFTGSLMLFLPLFMKDKHQNMPFRTQFTALILIWMVVFNFKSESPTFIIAMVGIGLWYFSSKQSQFQLYLFIGAFICTSLWFTDLIPKPLKEIFIEPEYIKPLFPIIIFWVLSYKLIFKNTFTFYTSKLKPSEQ